MKNKLNKLVLALIALLCGVAVLYLVLDIATAQDDIYELEESLNNRNVSTKINFVEQWEDIIYTTKEMITQNDPTTGQVNPPSVPGSTTGDGNLTTFYWYGDSSGPVFTDDNNTGWLGLYDAPTVTSSNVKTFNVNDVYNKVFGSTDSAKFCLQSFGGKAVGPNNSNKDFDNYYSGGGIVYLQGSKSGTMYESSVDDYRAGCLYINGIYRHMVAMGPSILYEERDYQKEKLSAANMGYGRLCDIKVSYNGNTYYIPCVVVDVKAHTATNGYIQTGVSIADGSTVSSATSAVMVEWYGVSGKTNTGKNRSSGLKYFTDVEIIMYLDSKIN